MKTAKYPTDHKLLQTLTHSAMMSGNLREAAKYAERFAAARFSYRPNDNEQGDELGTPDDTQKLSVLKLRHDIDQFRYLQKQGIKIAGMDSIIKRYTKVLQEILPLGDDVKVELTESQYKLIGKEYNRIIYRPHTPRVRRALSHNWEVITSPDDIASAENDFMQSSLGLSVIDNFLTREAITSLRKFCLESTIWFENRFAHGRLGAFFRQGFNCPLLVQIGEEVKAAFPNIIGEQHSLLQVWGFKCDHFQPFTAPHADFAAVNVNFWITPEEANLDQESGGMIIYDVEAPLDWDFDSYNNQGEKIINYLKKKKARAITIPYKANRAIIFNSDLFHATAPINFKDNYESRRINVTMLYGKREDAHLSHHEG